MGSAYPELASAQGRVEEVLSAEEAQFARTLDTGMALLEAALARLSGTVLPGELVFQLYDTYGFPVDLTNDIARERGCTLDLEGYERCMAEQRERARRGSRFHAEQIAPAEIAAETCFLGYDHLQWDGRVVALATGGQAVTRLESGAEVWWYSTAPVLCRGRRPSGRPRRIGNCRRGSLSGSGLPPPRR